MKYGSQTEAVERIIERIRDLTDAQTDQLVTAHNDAASSYYDAAFYAALGAARRTGSADVWDEVWDAARGASGGDVQFGTWAPVRDLVLATMTKHILTEDQYGTLMTPWRSVMG